MTKETTIIAGIGVALLFIFGGLAWWYASANPISENPLVVEDAKLIDGGQMTGDAGAKVTLVEWGDFQCPACGAAHPMLKQLIGEYSSNPDFNFVFQNFPLPMHKNAVIAAEAAEAAGAQGKYWEMHNLLYEKQNEWGEKGDPTELFRSYAEQIGIDTGIFSKALTDHTYKAKVQSDYAAARALGLDHTPTVFLNGVEQKQVSYTTLKEAIDTALAH